MKRYAYYNEYDPNAAEWLRQLIKLGQIPPGTVDERSITDVSNDTDSIKSFCQIHLFSGIGVIPYALRQAGWSDDREIMSGSCPCQPFSSAGKQKGFDDDRHLWPHMFKIIQELRPGVVIGEQVSSKLEWWDAVASDLESANYAAAAFDLPGASIGAYHRRYRLFWVGVRAVGDSKGERCQFQPHKQSAGIVKEMDAEGKSRIGAGTSGAGVSAVGDSSSNQWRGESGREVFAESEVNGGNGALEHPISQQRQEFSQSWADESEYTAAELRSGSVALVNTNSNRSDSNSRGCQKTNTTSKELPPRMPEGSDNASSMGHPNGEQPKIDITGVSTGGDRQIGHHSTAENRSRSTTVWDNTHWLQCSDGKYRAADRDIYPLAGVVGMDKPRIRYELERGLAELLPPGNAIERTEEIEGIAKLFIDTRNWGAIKRGALSLSPGIADPMGSSCDPSLKEIRESKEARNMRLKGYGNAIVAPLMKQFIESLMETI
jgi:site-specific DNA-cytosine methylase